MHIVKWLISDVMKLSHTDRITWLFIAAFARGDMKDVEQLATQVDSDVTRVMNQALRVACYIGKDDVVKWLVLHTTADVSSRGVIHDVDGEVTSLMVAFDMSNCGIVRKLLQCVTPDTVTVNMMSGDTRNTALHFIIGSEVDANLQLAGACMDGDIDTAADMVHVSNVNLQVTSGVAALHWACVYGHVDIVRMLLAVFASNDVTENYRRTPGIMASLWGHTEVLPYLQCTLSATHDSSVRESDNNNTLSISPVLSIEDATRSKINNTQTYCKARLSKIKLA
jgi:hypothetical protein